MSARQSWGPRSFAHRSLNARSPRIGDKVTKKTQACGLLPMFWMSRTSPMSSMVRFSHPQNRSPPTRNPNSRKLRLECAVRRRRSDRVRTFGCSPAAGVVIAKPAATVPATAAILAASVTCGADAGISPGSVDKTAPGGAGKLEVPATCAVPVVVGPTELLGASRRGG